MYDCAQTKKGEMDKGMATQQMLSEFQTQDYSKRHHLRDLKVDVI
jgi:hypothetical protein